MITIQVADMALAFGLFLLGVFAGWQLRDLKAESDGWRVEPAADDGDEESW